MDERIEYTEDRLNYIIKVIQGHSENGAPIYYQVFIDGLKVIPKTSKLDYLDLLDEFITDSTYEITFKLYSTSPTSGRHTKSILYFPENHPKKKTLDGLELESRLNERLKIERERWDTEQLKKDFNQVKERLKDAEEYIELLEKELENKSGESKDNWQQGLFKGLGAFSKFCQNNPKAAKQIPLLGSLTGLFEKDEEDTTKADSTSVSEVSYEAIEEESQEASVYDKLKEKLSDAEIERLIKINEHLTAHPEKINTITELL